MVGFSFALSSHKKSTRETFAHLRQGFVPSFLGHDDGDVCRVAEDGHDLAHEVKINNRVLQLEHYPNARLSFRCLAKPQTTSLPDFRCQFISSTL